MVKKLIYNKETILSFLEKETGANKSYGSNKFCFENIERAKIDYDDSHQKEWNVKESGETNPPKHSMDLKEKAEILQKQNIQPLFKYFLDGSRRTYKVDDVAYDNKIYPIVAGQIGVGCCERQAPDKFKNIIIEMHNVISMPSVAYADGHKADLYFNNLIIKINNLNKLKKMGIKFDKILRYSKAEDDKYENLAIAKIQDEMIELEKVVVSNLTTKKLLNADSFLIKDGSLEYKNIGKGNDRESVKIKNNYRHVIGVSKKFNPEIAGTKNITKLAELPLYHRTPAIKYQNYVTGEYVKFCIWYIRIRDAEYSASPFDGIVKIEKILVTDDENEKGLDSAEINNISAHLINERNPVCYGSDNRWANHLYPVYLTEKFIKSQYLSDIYYLNLF